MKYTGNMTHNDYKGNEINDEWFRQRKEEYKKEYISHYLPQKLKGKGYKKIGKRFTVYFKIFGETRWLGTYDTEEEAKKVYQKALDDFLENFDDYWDSYYE